MTREQAVQIVRELEAGANARDSSRVMRIYAQDAVLVSPVWDALPIALRSRRLGTTPSPGFPTGR